MTDRSTAVSPNFAARADSAAFWEAWVAGKLSRAGLYVLHHPFTLSTETGRPVESYAETVDLSVAVTNHNGVPWVDVEAKSVNLSFTNPNNYPHDDVLLCSANSFNRKWKNHGYRNRRDFLLVSRDTGEVVWVPRGVRVWEKPVHDSTRNEDYQCMVVHKADLDTFAGFVMYSNLRMETANEDVGGKPDPGYVCNPATSGATAGSGGHATGGSGRPGHTGGGRQPLQGAGVPSPGVDDKSVRKTRSRGKRIPAHPKGFPNGDRVLSGEAGEVSGQQDRRLVHGGDVPFRGPVYGDQASGSRSRGQTGGRCYQAA